MSNTRSYLDTLGSPNEREASPSDGPHERGDELQRSDDVDLVGLFKADLNKLDHKPLSPEATATLVTQCRKGTKATRAAAREQLIHSLLPLSLSMIRKFNRMAPEDVLSVALLAVVEAVDAAIKTYDVKQGGGLHNFVARAVTRALVDASDATGSVVRIPPQSHHEKRQLKKGVPLPEKTVQRLGALHRTDRSLDEEIEDEEGEGSPFSAFIADPHARIPEQVVSRKEGLKLLNDVFTIRLNARQASVVRLVFGVGPDGEEQPTLTHAEAGAELGIPTATVKALCAAALKQLRSVGGLQSLLKILIQPFKAYGESRFPIAPLAMLTKSGQPTKNTNQKLDEVSIRRIRLLKEQGMTQRSIATHIGVSEGTISMLLNRITHRKVG